MNKNERTGELFILAEVLLFALFPIFLVQSLGLIPPLFFAGLSSFIAGITFFLITLFKKQSFVLPKQALFPGIMGIIVIVLIVNGLLFIGGQHTSPGNSALLIQSEVVFTFLFFGLLGLERITLKRVSGSAIILLGSIFILFNGFSGNISKWDVIILFGISFAPLGNFFQKKTLGYISPLTYGVYRSIFGGIILFCISFIFENPLENIEWSQEILLLILANGILILGLSKWFFFEAIQRMGVSKSIALTATVPAITILLTFLFLHEAPTLSQYIGLLGVIIGVPLIVAPIPELIFTGKTKRGDGIGKKIGFPTINIETTKKTPKGVYAAYAEISGKKYKGILHCGPRPSFRKMQWRNEIYLFDFYSEHLHQRKKKEILPENTPVTFFIEKRIRRIKKFSSVEKLIQALENDKKRTEEFFEKK